MKTKLVNIVLWLAYLLALAASLSHVAATFNTLEKPGQTYGGWLAAIAVDAGLAALAYAIRQRKRAKRGTLMLWIGVATFAAISAYANVLHALSVDNSSLIKAIAFSATLPLLVVYLGEIVSSDDAAQAETIEREQRREAAKAERTAALAERTAPLAATQSAVPAISSDTPAPLARVKCDKCDLTFTNRFALSAHQRTHRTNGTAASELAAPATPAETLPTASAN